ncbi:hypothetical protein HDU83_003317 [Entophlyctis luteolus]|nr:hypothetical protein HDU83_003317 [Entophlyctis luteolus]
MIVTQKTSFTSPERKRKNGEENVDPQLAVKRRRRTLLYCPEGANLLASESSPHSASNLEYARSSPGSSSPSTAAAISWDSPTNTGSSFMAVNKRPLSLSRSVNLGLALKRHFQSSGNADAQRETNSPIWPPTPLHATLVSVFTQKLAMTTPAKRIGKMDLPRPVGNSSAAPINRRILLLRKVHRDSAHARFNRRFVYNEANNRWLQKPQVALSASPLQSSIIQTAASDERDGMNESALASAPERPPMGEANIAVPTSHDGAAIAGVPKSNSESFVRVAPRRSLHIAEARQRQQERELQQSTAGVPVSRTRVPSRKQQRQQQRLAALAAAGIAPVMCRDGIRAAVVQTQTAAARRAADILDEAQAARLRGLRKSQRLVDRELRRCVG